MKKVIIFLLTFFLINTNVSASSKIDSIDISVNIKKSGEAIISESWNISNKNDGKFEKIFYDVSSSTISDIKVLADNKEYKSVSKLNKKSNQEYSFTKKRSNAFITIVGKENIKNINLTYKVKGIISKYKDISGINWFFYVVSDGIEVGNINIYVASEEPYNETNTALYAIGNNITAEFSKGKIHLLANNLKTNNEIKLMTTFTDIVYEESVNVDSSFDEAYVSSLKQNNFIDKMMANVTTRTKRIVLLVLIVIILTLIITRIVYLLKKHDEFYNIITVDNLNIKELKQSTYVENTPCNKDLYKIAFLADYFKLLKNKTDLIGAILLKWVYEGKVNILNDKTKCYLELKSDLIFKDYYENELYNMLVSSTSNLKIDSGKLRRYTYKNYDRVLKWFRDVQKYVLMNEINKGTIKQQKKLNSLSLVMQKELIDEANNIQGLKKYLLHFNQVPRQTKLTENEYKYLLIVAELLGIGEQIGKEILRKSPDNVLAKILIGFENSKSIYHKIYDIAINELDLTNNHTTSLVDDIENILKSNNSKKGK